MRPQASVCRTAALLVCSVLGACSPKPAHPDLGPLVPVRGRVTHQGKPVALAQVIYAPDPEGDGRIHAPAGSTDADGNYQLAVFGTAGAPPGHYAVGIIAGPGGPKLPDRLRNPKTSGLTREVAKDAPPGAYDVELGK